MYWLTQILTHLSAYVRRLLVLSAHPESGWTTSRRRFAVQLVVALAAAGDVMFSEIVRHMPKRGVAMRHRYKVANRMLGEVDLVTVAGQQTAELGRRVGHGDVIAVDLSDITKPYAKVMPYLHKVRDGSTGEIGVGYGLALAVAVNPNAERRALPLPLMFEVFSPSEEDFKSQPAVWLDMLRRLIAGTRHGTFAIDREGDNGRIISLLLRERRHFVIRLQVHDNSRHLLFDDDSRARVSDLWEGARFYGELEATRILDDGRKGPYRARYGSRPVRFPGFDRKLWLCVFKSPDHKHPLVLLTSHRAECAKRVCDVLAMYFARWSVEEMHRFIKQELKLENIRALTWKRLKNLVAAAWIVAGAIAAFCQRPAAEQALRTFEVRGQRLIKPLKPQQFWGYAIVAGLRASPEAMRRALALIPGFWSMPPPGHQPELFGGRA
jgi:hypothetical protein